MARIEDVTIQEALEVKTTNRTVKSSVLMLKKYDAKKNRNLKVKNSFEDYRRTLTRRLIGSTSYEFNLRQAEIPEERHQDQWESF